MKTTPIFIILIILFSCNAQEKKQLKKSTQKYTEMTTEKFDIEKFEKNKINNECNFILEDGTTVRQTGDENNYIEYIMPPKPNLIEIYRQFYKSGKLQRHILSFPNDFLILKKEYDENGNLTEEINYDTPYKFTFEQLLELIKKEKDTIDLYDKNTSIGRSTDTTGTFWYITYKKISMRRERIKIDGITGEILERSHYPHEDN